MLFYRKTFAILTLFLGAVFAGLGWITSAAGHGTFFFFSIAVFPYGLGLLLWLMIGFFLADVGQPFQRTMFLTTIFVRYLVIGIYVFNYWSYEWPHIKITWAHSRLFILAPIIVFFAWQAFIWAFFIRRMRQKRLAVSPKVDIRLPTP
jgi:hypothetical protein